MWGYPEFYIPVPGGYGTESHGHLGARARARGAGAGARQGECPRSSRRRSAGGCRRAGARHLPRRVDAEASAAPGRPPARRHRSGRVLVEQEGEEFLADEERIRAVARGAREGGTRRRLREAVRALAARAAGEGAARVRALLPAREHRRAAPPHPPPREYERRAARRRASRSPRRSSCSTAASAEAELGAARRHVSLELVLTAHPTEATRRTILAAHLRHRRGCWPRSTTPMLPARAGTRRRGGARREITMLWQTDEVRGQTAARDRRDPPRPLVLRGEPARRRAARCSPSYRERLSRTRRRRFASAPGSAATATATRPPGRQTIAAALERARELALGALPRGGPRRSPCALGVSRRSLVARLATSWTSRSRATSASCPSTPPRSARRTRSSRTGASSRFVWWRLGNDGYARADELLADLERDRPQPPRAPAARASPTARWPRCAGASSCSASTSRSSTCACTRATSPTPSEARARDVRAVERARRHGAEALDTRDRLGDDVRRGRPRRARARRASRSRSCRCSRRSTTCAPRPRSSSELLDDAAHRAPTGGSR